MIAVEAGPRRSDQAPHRGDGSCIDGIEPIIRGMGVAIIPDQHVSIADAHVNLNTQCANASGGLFIDASRMRIGTGPLAIEAEGSRGEDGECRIRSGQSEIAPGEGRIGPGPRFAVSDGPSASSEECFTCAEGWLFRAVGRPTCANGMMAFEDAMTFCAEVHLTCAGQRVLSAERATRSPAGGGLFVRYTVIPHQAPHEPRGPNMDDDLRDLMDGFGA